MCMMQRNWHFFESNHWSGVKNTVSFNSIAPRSDDPLLTVKTTTLSLAPTNDGFFFDGDCLKKAKRTAFVLWRPSFQSWGVRFRGCPRQPQTTRNNARNALFGSVRILCNDLRRCIFRPPPFGRKRIKNSTVPNQTQPSICKTDERFDEPPPGL